MVGFGRVMISEFQPLSRQVLSEVQGTTILICYGDTRGIHGKVSGMTSPLGSLGDAPGGPMGPPLGPWGVQKGPKASVLLLFPRGPQDV